MEEDFGLGAEDAPKEEAVPEESFGLGVDEAPAPEPTQEADEPAKEVARRDEVPDTYEFEGEDEAFNAEVGAVAKEIGLSQEKAQKMATAIERANEDFYLNALKELAGRTKKDPEIGGAQFNKSIATVRSIFARYAEGDELQEVFRSTGVGSHPEFIRMMVRINRDLPPAPRKSMFPNSRMEG